MTTKTRLSRTPNINKVMDDRKKSECFNIYHHRAGKSEENDSENISIDLSEEEKTVNNLPYYY